MSAGNEGTEPPSVVRTPTSVARAGLRSHAASHRLSSPSSWAHGALVAPEDVPV